MSGPWPSTRLLRFGLGLGAAANFGVAALLLVPDSAAGQLAGLPSASVPILYASLLALFVALFGGVYAWLAAQVEINRPVLALGAIGKALAFILGIVLWLAGSTSARWTGLMVGDLLLAALFAAWLWQHRQPGPSASH
ncbi:MAG: hypothetical protein Q8Q73_05130 [Stagnimonas sp.]|nr:hypothetical protein [Stagnimonas sp.]